MIQLKKPYVTTLPYTDDMRKLPVLINGDTAILFLEPINIDGDKVETLIMLPELKGNRLNLKCLYEYTVTYTLEQFEADYTLLEKTKPVVQIFGIIEGGGL